jgi:hypothetical protein
MNAPLSAWATNLGEICPPIDWRTRKTAERIAKSASRGVASCDVNGL